jgi:hypothetical protein
MSGGVQVHSHEGSLKNPHGYGLFHCDAKNDLSPNRWILEDLDVIAIF